MEGHRRGSSTPSYKDVVASKGKTPLSNVKGSAEEEKRNNEKKTDGAKTKENSGTKDKEGEDKS